MSGSGFTLRPRPPLDNAEGILPLGIETDSASIARIALAPVFIGPRGAASASLLLREATLVAGNDGEQILSLPSPAISAGTLFINGLAQSSPAVVHDAISISIPESLNVLADDVLHYVYQTLGDA